jgi:ACS family glucarate transporter-like MFS transporter
MSGTKIETGTTTLEVRYLLVLWLGVLSAVAYLDRTNISIAGVHIAREFSINNTHLGWVFSAFLVGYAGLQIPAGLLARKLGSRRVLALAFVWCSIFTVLTTLVPPGIGGALFILILVRFALGAGEATMYPATSQFVQRWFPIQERGKANGFIFGGIGIGSGLTPPLVTAIILHHGWRASFWFCAFAELLVALVWYLAARDTPEQHFFVGNAERLLIENGRCLPNTAAKQNSPASGQAVPWLKIFCSRQILSLMLSYYTFGYVAWIFLFWFYTYLAQARDLNLKTSAVYAMLPFIAMTIGCLLGGSICDWIAGRYGLRMGRCLLPAIAMALTAIFLVLGSRTDGAKTAVIILACGAGALYLAQSSFWAVAADIAGDHVGVVSSIMNMGGQIGGACTASLTPLIAAHFGWNMSFATAASLAVLGAILWTVINPRKILTADAVPKPTALSV